MGAKLAKSLSIWLNTSRKDGIISASWSSTLPELGLNDARLIVLHLPCGPTPVILQVFSLALWLFKLLFPLSLRLPPSWTGKLLESLDLQCVDDFSRTAVSSCASKSNKTPFSYITLNSCGYSVQLLNGNSMNCVENVSLFLMLRWILQPSSGSDWICGGRKGKFF